jgi:Flp pilus assembly protein TadB
VTQNKTLIDVKKICSIFSWARKVLYHETEKRQKYKQILAELQCISSNQSQFNASIRMIKYWFYFNEKCGNLMNATSIWIVLIKSQCVLHIVASVLTVLLRLTVTQLLNRGLTVLRIIYPSE